MESDVSRGLDHGITCIDAGYISPWLACFYLLGQDGEYALIETGVDARKLAWVYRLLDRHAGERITARPLRPQPKNQAMRPRCVDIRAAAKRRPSMRGEPSSQWHSLKNAWSFTLVPYDSNPVQNWQDSSRPKGLLAISG